MKDQIFIHAETFYKALKENSRKKKVAGGKFQSYFEGKLTLLYSSIGISQTHYGTILNRLESLGCIERIQRGTKGNPSIVLLNYPPDHDAWKLIDEGDESDLTKPDRYAILAQRVQDLTDQLGGINIVEALKNLDNRIAKLEKRRVNGSQKK